MINLLEVARELQVYCDANSWRSCFIGGLAVQRWSQPRVTLDVDLVLLTGFGDETIFTDALLSKYTARIEDAGEFALKNRVLLLKTTGGVAIDISLGALPFEEQIVNRATVFSFAPGFDIRTCSAEDLMVLKLFASRPIDINDAEAIALRHKAQLDWQYIQAQLEPLAAIKEAPEILQALERLRNP